MDHGGSVEPFFVQMVQIIIACIHERFAIVVVHVSYILLVLTHFCLGTRKVYHHVEIIWLQKTQDVKDDKMTYSWQKACWKCVIEQSPGTHERQQNEVFERKGLYVQNKTMTKGWGAKSWRITLTKVKMLTTYTNPVNDSFKKKSNQRYPESK